MTFFLLVLLLALAIPLLAGFSFGIRMEGSPATRLGWTLLGGLTLLFALLLPLNAWMGTDRFAWPLFLLLVLLAIRRFRREGFSWFAGIGNLKPSWWLPRLAAQLVVLGLLAWPPLREGLPVQYDGTPCNDNLQFTTDLVVLKQQGYLQPVIWDSEHPFKQLATTIIGYAPTSGRVSAQSLGAVIATLLFQDAVWVHSGFFASYAVLWSLACCLLLRALAPRDSLAGWRGLVADLLVILHPMGFFFIINGNMANAFGVVISTILWMALRQTQAYGFTPTRLALVSLGALALAGTYPELVPFTGLAGGLVFISDLLRKGHQVWTAKWWAPVAVATAGLFLFPPTTIRTFKTVQVAMTESRSASNPENASKLPPNLFANLDRSAYLPAFTTMATRLAERPGWVVMLALTLIISLCWAVGLYVAKDRPLAWGWAVAFDVAALMVKQSGYGYGWQKISQYHASILAVVAILGALYMVPSPFGSPHRKWRPAGWIPLITLSLWFLYSLVNHANSLVTISHEKSLSRDHLQLAAFNQQLRNASADPLPEPWVLEDQTMPVFVASYYQSVWVPRFLDGRAFAWDDSGALGGYNATITRKVSEFPWPPPVHVQYRYSMVESGGKELLATEKFRIIENPVIARVQGLYLQERQVSPTLVVSPWGPDPAGTKRFAWMGDVLKVWVDAPSNGKLQVHLGDRFEHTPRPDHLLATTPEGPVKIPMPPIDTTMDKPFVAEIPLKAGRQVVEIKVPSGAKSPAQVGLSVDNRPLSFKVLAVRFE